MPNSLAPKLVAEFIGTFAGQELFRERIGLVPAL